MRLERIDIAPSPTGSGRTRVEAAVRYDSGTPREERYWFDLPRERAPAAPSGDAWLVALLPLAVTLGEPLHVAAPVDPGLLSNTRHLISIWRSWYRGTVANVAVTADAGGAPPPTTRTGAFFSGGVDSFYTLLRHRDNGEPALTDLITVWGYDLPVDATEAIARLRPRYDGLASSRGLGYVDVATNLRRTRWASADWGRLAHGCALAAAALVQTPAFVRVIIPATGGYRDLHPWGSHPLTDPLLSTGYTSFAHDGAHATRVGKTRVLEQSADALGLLRVCWVSADGANCGACSKCVRTMAMLELIGALGRCPAFPARTLAPDRLARVYCAQSWDYREMRDIARLAGESGRPDMARAARRAIRRSRWLSPRVAAACALRRHPAGRNLGAWWERRLLAGGTA